MPPLMRCLGLFISTHVRTRVTLPRLCGLGYDVIVLRAAAGAVVAGS